MECFSVAVLIPCFQPGPGLVQAVAALAGSAVPLVVVVDDGSGSDSRGIFDAVEELAGVTVLRHAIPLGNAAALRTGVNFILCERHEYAAVVVAEGSEGVDVAAILSVARGKFRPGMRVLLREELPEVLRGMLPSGARSRSVKSCFLDGILHRQGLSLREHIQNEDDVTLEQGDVLMTDHAWAPEVIFSVGMIEHFDPGSVAAQIAPLRQGGCAILAFPLPTRLHSAILRRFGRQVPPRRAEVLAMIGGLGEVVFEKTIAPMLFTQHLVVVRKV